MVSLLYSNRRIVDRLGRRPWIRLTPVRRYHVFYVTRRGINISNTGIHCRCSCRQGYFLIKTTIEAGYHEDDTITLRHQPERIRKLNYKVNRLTCAAFVDGGTVRQRGLRMASIFDLLPYTDDWAMKLLSAQWKHHDPGNTHWTTGEE